MVQPVCSQCQSMMERYRQSVGHTLANQGKYKFYNLQCTIELSHWYKVDKVFYTPEAKLRCVKITSYIMMRS